MTQTKPIFIRLISLILIAVLCVSAVCALGGCKKKGDGTPHITVGTLATEDFLPMWVAEKEGIFSDLGLDVELVTFQSAAELIAGITSGEVDYAMTDPLVSASIFASGTNVRIEWVTLGTTAAQGRFGIMTSGSSGITQANQLAGKKIAVGSNTMLEYIMEKLLANEGVAVGTYTKEEIQKLSVRYQTMAAGQVDAAVLPAGLLAVGEANGCVCILDDTEGENLSQSVMISRLAFLGDEEGGAATLDLLKEAWNTAVRKINNNNSAYRSLLLDKGAISDALADSYKVSNYPEAELPKASTITPILDWMQEKGYLTTAVTYDETTGAFAPAA